MPFFETTRTEVIDHLVDYVLKKLPPTEASLVKHFVRQYYLNVSPEDLTSRTLLDLYGAAMSHWHYLSERMPGEFKVRVYNPILEQHGWQSKHTIVEIVVEDMPFLDDSITMELNRQELIVHLIHMGTVRVRRDATGHITQVLEVGASPAEENDWITEAAIYVEIDRQSDPAVLEKIEASIRKVLNDIKIVARDWPRMRGEALTVLSTLEKSVSLLEKDEVEESIAFLRWIIEDHFTFMGYRGYSLVGEGFDKAFQPIAGTSCGLLIEPTDNSKTKSLSDFSHEGQQVLLSKQIVIVGKTNKRSTVHRPVYADFIAIKMFDDKGVVIGEHYFIGLFTAITYTSRPKQIPFLRRKVNAVLSQSGFAPKSHDERVLLNILETLPRDDLFQASVTELLELAAGIYHLQERQRIRLFIRKDTWGSFYSCLIFVPRESYNSQLRERMQDILMRGLQGTEAEFSTRFSESSLARVHFIIRVALHKETAFDIKYLEQELIDAARTWQDDLRSALVEHGGEERGNDLYKRYAHAFPAGYREAFSARIAVVDIDYFEALSDQTPLLMSLYHPIEEPEEVIRFKLFRMGATIPLSDVVPILENMGLRIISERPYEITPNQGTSIWINDYRMVHPMGQAFDTEVVKDIFQEAFGRIWWGLSENDGFNRLVLNAKLNAREIDVLRAYAKYLWQTGFTFSQDHVEDALSANAKISYKLIELFKMRFNPEVKICEADLLAHNQEIEKELENVNSLNEDRILRRYMHTIMATVRTNYYQKNNEGQSNSYFSFKLDSAKVPELPLPVPLYEIFVYSPRVEAIHLRAAKVARGGIRWSDRREDFRTEVLGLMKAQQVKNAVIVPMGAKGGFVVKKPPENATREQMMEEVINCYKTMIRGMLDITDNSKGNEIIPPESVVRYDDNDPYLVVAADKGTATFSDIANAVSEECGFWLGDAFASGGKTGYDHKKMGITARGVWESVKRHFHEMGVDPETTDFTVVGIGDMSGDVFGNGLLLCRHMKLVAAFNHMHIFLDPNPDPEKSYLERERLFNLPRSTWADYDANLLSPGGGIYLRSAKSISLSPEMQAALDFHQDKVVPNELIRIILKAPVDLLWNGGIGTYVKASRESNADVGDRTNDAVRVNGSTLRCKVVGEGGNLGFTQLGRIEYAKSGGRLNTDAIDNSGGVNCSDNEVNIKILLNGVVEQGDLTEKQRNILLAEMQEEVAELVLNNNRKQPEAISVAVSQAVTNLEMHSRLIQEMERSGDLDRALEFLPDRDEIEARKAAKQGLTRPEFAVLMAYSKILLKKAFLASDLPEEPFFQIELELAFPKPLQVRYKDYMLRHRLKREIIATQVSNAVINEMGITFLNRLQDETGAEPSDILRAYTISREVFEAPAIHAAIDELNTEVDSSIQLKMVSELNRLVRRGARWFLRNRRPGMNIAETIEGFAKPVAEISNLLPKLLVGIDTEMEKMVQELMEQVVPKPLAERVACMSGMFSALDIVEAATKHKFLVAQVAGIYYAIGYRMNLGWFRELIKRQPIRNHWEALARAAFRDDLDRQQRNLTIGIMHHNGESLNNPSGLIDRWFTEHRNLVNRWEYFINELKNTPNTDFTMFAVALRELLDLAQASAYRKK